MLWEEQARYEEREAGKGARVPEKCHRHQENAVTSGDHSGTRSP
jgi:hypothetical protein